MCSVSRDAAATLEDKDPDRDSLEEDSLNGDVRSDFCAVEAIVSAGDCALFWTPAVTEPLGADVPCCLPGATPPANAAAAAVAAVPVFNSHYAGQRRPPATGSVCCRSASVSALFSTGPATTTTSSSSNSSSSSSSNSASASCSAPSLIAAQYHRPTGHHHQLLHHHHQQQQQQHQQQQHQQQPHSRRHSDYTQQPSPLASRRLCPLSPQHHHHHQQQQLPSCLSDQVNGVELNQLAVAQPVSAAAAAGGGSVSTATAAAAAAAAAGAESSPDTSRASSASSTSRTSNASSARSAGNASNGSSSNDRSRQQQRCPTGHQTAVPHTPAVPVAANCAPGPLTRLANCQRDGGSGSSSCADDLSVTVSATTARRNSRTQPDTGQSSAVAKKECAFFVDLNEPLAAVGPEAEAEGEVEPKEEGCGGRRHSHRASSLSDASRDDDHRQAVYLYIDMHSDPASAPEPAHCQPPPPPCGGRQLLERGGWCPPAGLGMAASYHGQSLLAGHTALRNLPSTPTDVTTAATTSLTSAHSSRDLSDVTLGATRGGFITMGVDSDDDLTSGRENGAPAARRGVRAPLPSQLSARLQLLEQQRRLRRQHNNNNNNNNNKVASCRAVSDSPPAPSHYHQQQQQQPRRQSCLPRSGGGGSDRDRGGDRAGNDRGAPMTASVRAQCRSHSVTTAPAAAALHRSCHDTAVTPSTVPSTSRRALAAGASCGGGVGYSSASARSPHTAPARAGSARPSVARARVGVSSAGEKSCTAGGGTGVGGAGGGRVVMGATRRVSSTLHTRSVTRRSHERHTPPASAGAMNGGGGGGCAKSPGRGGSVVPGCHTPHPRHQQQQQGGRQQQHQGEHRSYLRAHSGHGANATAHSAPSSSPSMTAVVAPVGREPVAPRSRLPGATTRCSSTSAVAAAAAASCSGGAASGGGGGGSDAGSDMSSSVNSSHGNNNNSGGSGRPVNSVWSREAESVRQLVADLQTLLTSQYAADLIIQTRDSQLSCHSVILATRCPHLFSLASSSSSTYSSSTAPSRNGPPTRTLATADKHICLDSHSSRTVGFLLSHVYTGSVQVPAGVDLFDLLALATAGRHPALIGVADSAIRSRHCHMFHKPCCECVPGVLRALTAAVDFGLSCLSDRCLDWLSQHRVAVWSDPAASSSAHLPSRLTHWCLNSVFHLSESTLLDVLIDCSQLMNNICRTQTARETAAAAAAAGGGGGGGWLTAAFHQLVDRAVVMASRCLLSLLGSDRFMCACECDVTCALLQRHLLRAAEMQNGADAASCVELLWQLETLPRDKCSQGFVSLTAALRDVCVRRSASAIHSYSSQAAICGGTLSADSLSTSSSPLTMTAEEVQSGSFRRQQLAEQCGYGRAEEEEEASCGLRRSSRSLCVRPSPPAGMSSSLCVARCPAERDLGARSGRTRTVPAGGAAAAAAAATVTATMSRSESFTICRHE